MAGERESVTLTEGEGGCTGQTRRETRTEKGDRNIQTRRETHTDTYRHTKAATEPYRARVYIRGKLTYTVVYTQKKILQSVPWGGRESKPKP